MNEITEFKEFSIRVPVELFEVISADAANNERSRNAQVIVVLKKYYGEKTNKSSDEEKGN